VEPGDALHVRLDVAQLLSPEEAHAGYAVRHGSLVDVIQPSALDLVECDEQLPALVVRDAAPCAELAQHRHAAPTQGRLERAGRVVEAGVHHAAVAPGLMLGERVLLLQQRDRGVGVDLEQPAGYRSAEDATADHGDAVRAHDGRSR
jgi:hypothetical protein